MSGPWDDYSAPAQDTASEVGPWSEHQAPKSSLLRRGLGDTGISLLKGAISVPEAIVGLADIPTGGIAGKAAEQAGFRPKEAKATLDEYLSPEQKAANAKVQAAEGFFGTTGAMLENPSTILQTGLESVPAMLGGGVVARGARALPGIGQKLAPWVAGAIGEGTVSAGMSAEQVRQQTEDGLLTAGQSGLSALTGFGTGLIGAGGAKLANKLGVGEIDTLLAGGTAQASGKGIARRAAEGAAVEGVLQELPQSAQEQALQNIALDRPWNEGIGEAAAAGLLTGGVLGGIAGPLGGRPVAPEPVITPAIDPSAGVISRAASLAPSAVADVTRASLLNGAPGQGQASKYTPADLETAVAQQLFSSELDANGKLVYSRYNQDLQAVEAVDAKTVAEAVKAHIQQAGELGFDPLDNRPLDQLLPTVEEERGPQGTGQAADDLSPYERNQLRATGVSDEQLAGMSTQQARQVPGLPTVDFDSGPQATEEINQPLPLATVDFDSGPQSLKSIEASAADPLAITYKGVPGAKKALNAMPDADLYEVTKVADKQWRIQVKAPAAPKRTKVKVDREHDSLSQAVIRLGGLKTTHRQDTTGDSKGNKHVPGVGALWSDKTGTGLDDMASLLDQNGYVPAGEMDNLGGVPWLQAALRDEVDGRKTHYAPGSARQESESAKAEAERYSRNADRLPGDDLEGRLDAAFDLTEEVAALEARRIKALRHAQELDALFGDDTDGPDIQAASPRETDPRAEQAPRPAEPGSDSARSEQPDQGSRAEAPRDTPAEPLELTQQTEQDLAEQAASQAAAAAKQAAKAKAVTDKAQADKDRNDFNLSGSDRAADMATAAGQTDIFAQPAADEKAPAAPASIEGADIDGDWAQFSKGSGTLGIPRADMPQIQAEHRGAMVNFLNARDISHETETVPAVELKPTQAEYSRKKVAKAKAFDGGDRSILISKDGHVLDGHHQWLAKRDAGEDVKVIRLDAPIKQLLSEVAEFPSAGVDDASGAVPAAGQAKPVSEKSISTKVVETQDQAQAAADFPLTEAAASYSGISHSGTSRAKSDAGEFQSYLDVARDAGQAVARTEAQEAAVEQATSALRADYLTQYGRLMSVRAGTYSGFVAGRSNLNSKQADKRNSAYDRALETFGAWQKANQDAVRKAALDARTDEEKAADQAAAEQARTDKVQEKHDGEMGVVRKILSWSKGSGPVKLTKGTLLVGVNKGRDGYPSSLKLMQEDGTTLIDDKFDVAALLRNRKEGESVPAAKRRARELVDAVRAEDAVTAAQAEQAPAQEDSTIPLLKAHEDAMAQARDGKIEAGAFREAFARVEEGREAILAELNSMTKDKLLRSGGVYFYHRYKSEKKDRVVDSLYRTMLDEYALGNNYGPTSYMMTAGGAEAHRKAKAQALRDLVANTDDAALQQFAVQVVELRKENEDRKQATQKALTDPQTISEFRSAITYATEKHNETRQQAYLRLTPEQRQRYDNLEAESNKEAREQAKAKQRTQVATAGNTTASEVIASKHTKLGHDLFVVKLADKLPADEYRTLLASAKRMGGSYSSFRGNGAIPGFQFRARESAEAFRKLVEGDTADAQEIAEARRDAFEDDRSQSAAERLNSMADALNERADEALNRDRKVNTSRRARMANSAEASARADKSLAGTMSNLAQAIDSGAAKFLDAVRQKVQVEFLTRELRNAKDAQLRAKYPSYGEQEKHQGEPVDAETVDHAAFPFYSAFRSDLAGIARQMLDVDGTKKLGAKLLTLADDVSEAYTDWAKQNLLQVSRFSRGEKWAEFANKESAERAIRSAGLTGTAVVLPIKRGVNRIVLSPSEAQKLGLWSGDGDKRITLGSEFGSELMEAVGRRAQGKIKMPWQLESAHEKRKRLRGMGIFTGSEFRAALREFAGIQQSMATPDKIKQMERAMVGRRNDGLDFFPTSEAPVDAMLEAAEIEEGMAVLEPSAGMGHIADAIREKTGAEPDVVELSGDRRELLEAKGYNLVGDDFIALEPRTSFTFGDVFRHQDGELGVMRGSNGLGGSRVGFQPLGEDGQPDARRSRWVDRDDLTGVEFRSGQRGYDRILMNPPFSKGRDIQHVRHAYDLLRPGGRIVAIMGEGAFFHGNKAAEGFRAWLDELGATSEKLPDGSFMDPSLPVNTAVSARMVVIDKPAVEGQQSRYRLSPERAKGIPLFSARAMAGKIAKAAGLKVETVANEDGLPDAVQAQIKRDGVSGRVAGVYHNGTSYLIASNLRDTQHAISTVLHEAVGHGGVKAVLGSKIAGTMRQVYRDMPSALRGELERRYAGQTQGLSQDDAQALIAEEYVAHLAETDPKHGIIGRLVAMLRQFIRSTFGDAAALKWTRGDLVQLLAEARQAAGRDGNDGGSRYSAAEAMPLPQVSEASEADFVASLTGSNAFARAIYKAQGTDSPFFQRWFGKSRMVDKQGRPVAFVHRSYGERDTFSDTDLGGNTGTPTAALGHYLARKDVGNVERYGPVTEQFYIRMNKPKVVTQDQFEAMGDWSLTKVKAYRTTLMQQGHDGLYIQGLAWPVVFEGKNIKAARNSGTFDDSASTRYSLADDARSLFDRTTGPAPLERDDPFAAENRRLREGEKTLWQKAKKQFARQFAPGGLLPDAVFDEKITRDSEFQAVEFDVRHLSMGLSKAVKADFGVDLDNLTAEQMKPLAEALSGKVDPAIPEATKVAIVSMRQYIDSLSGEYLSILQKQVEANMEGSDQALIDKITGNLGAYVNRSYQAFDDPKWFKTVPTEVVNAARTYLAKGYIEQGETAAEAARLADVTVNEMLKTGTAYDSMGAFIAEGKLGAKDLTVLIKRKEIAPEIRALLGEYMDPRLNFAKSATKMGRLVWNQRFLDRVLSFGMGTFLFEGKDRPADATTQIAGEQSETYAPLNGLWTFPEVAQSFKDALGKEQMSDLYRTVVRLNGMVKYGKTILSPTTAMRNWQSAMFFSLANGHFDLTQMKKSWAAMREQVTQNATGDDLAYLRKLKQLGVVYDTPYAGEMMALLQDARMDELLSSKSGTGLKWLRKANQFAQGFYSFGDDFWKIIGYENEKAGLLQAGIPLAEAEAMAAKRIRDTYPTYSMIGKAVQWLRRFPLAGTFVSFPSEIIRTTVNMMQLTAADMKSDNPGLRALGRKRAAGMALVSGGFYALAAMTAAAFGVGDDEEEALRDLAAPWSKNSTFLYTGRDADGKLRYFDMSFLDPYGYWKRPLTAMMRDQPWEDSAASGISDMLSPFFGADISAGAIFEVLANKKPTGGQVYNEHAGSVDQLQDIADHMRKALQPGFVSNAERLYLAGTEARREGSGQPYSVHDEVVSLLGWRAATLDTQTGLYYRSFDFSDALSDARKTLTRTLRSSNAVSEGDIRDSKRAAEAQYQKAFTEMGRLVSAAEVAGMSRGEIVQTLKLSGVAQRNIFALISGRVPSMDISMQAQAKAVRQARVMRDSEHAAEIARRFRLARE